MTFRCDRTTQAGTRTTWHDTEAEAEAAADEALRQGARHAVAWQDGEREAS